MSRIGDHRREKWVSIKRLRNPDTLRQIRMLFDKSGIRGSYYDPVKPSTAEVVRLIKLRRVGVRLIPRERDQEMLVIYLRRRVPVCGTVGAFFWRLFPET